MLSADWSMMCLSFSLKKAVWVWIIGQLNKNNEYVHCMHYVSHELLKAFEFRVDDLTELCLSRRSPTHRRKTSSWMICWWECLSMNRWGSLYQIATDYFFHPDYVYTQYAG